MNPFGHLLLSCIVGLASAYTVVVHILPADIKYHMIAITIIAICGVLLVQRLSPLLLSFVQRVRGLSAVERRYYLAIGLLLTIGIFCWLGNQHSLRKIDIQITATGLKNISSGGQQVRVKGAYADNEYLNIVSFIADYHGWEMLNNSWVIAQNQPMILRWQGLAGKEIRLLFETSPRSGQAIVTAGEKVYNLDLYAREDSNQELVIPVGNFADKTKISKMLIKATDVITAILLTLILLLLSSNLRNKSNSVTSNFYKPRVYRRWLLRSAGLLVCGVTAISVINYVVDPLQFYHRAWYAPHWSKEQRYQNPGIAKNYSYDNVLLGTSMLENYIPAQIDEWLGTKSVKLTISGSSIYEQVLTLQLALQTNQVKSVIWGLDFMAFGGAVNRVETENGAFPMHLYQPDYVNGMRYLFNYSTTEQSKNIILHKLRLAPYQTPQFPLLNAWQYKAVFGSESVKRNFKQIKTADFDRAYLRYIFNANHYVFNDFKNNIDVNMIPIITANPQVHFDLFYPPYHVLFYTAFYQQNPQSIMDWLLAKQYVAERLSVYDNVTVHDFQGETRYIFDDSRYKDLLHYNKSTADELIQKIKKGSDIVDKTTIGIHNQQLLKIIQTSSDTAM